MFTELLNLIWDSGFFYIDWRMLVMWAVVAVLFYLAVKREFEPLLLIPIAFGALLANLPTQGVTNKPAGDIFSEVSGTVSAVFVTKGMDIELPRVIKDQPDSLWRLAEDGDSDEVIAQKIKDFFVKIDAVASKELRVEGSNATHSIAEEIANAQAAGTGIPFLAGIVTPSKALRAGEEWKNIQVTVSYMGKEIVVSPKDSLVWADATGTIVEVPFKVGDSIIRGESIATAFSAHSGGLYYYLQKGVLLEIFPPLIFLGVGALTDFGPLIANPRTLLLGAAAQFGVLFTFFGALFLGFSSPQAASIGIIGGADGPTSIFLANKLAPTLMAPIAVAAYSYMALVPVIQPPIMRALTTMKERRIRMKSLRKVSRLEKLIFAMFVTIFCIMITPDVSALIGMLMLGNFIRESGVCERLNKAAQNEIINVVTIFLGTSVGITMTGDKFLRIETLSILLLGVIAFMVSTGAGVIMAKFMNLFTKDKINPLIGSAGVSAVPMAARVSHVEGQKADSSNFLLMHAMGPNVAGVIGTAIVAGFFIATIAPHS